MGLTTANSPFAIRLSRHYDVDETDLEQLEELKFKQVAFDAGREILRRGAEMKQVILLASGWAARCRYTPDGRRQIVHLILPGDIVTPGVFSTRRTDHGISALSNVLVRFVDTTDMQRLFSNTTTIAAAFWWSTEQEYGVLREQIVRLGRRSALHRIPHLFLELYRRLLLVNQASGKSFSLPLTQNDIADTLGLSSVHVNRTLRRLVSSGLITYDGSTVEIVDSESLAMFCDFDISHLHLDQTQKSGPVAV